jgi:hypothetical protein
MVIRVLNRFYLVHCIFLESQHASRLPGFNMTNEALANKLLPARANSCTTNSDDDKTLPLEKKLLA